MSRVCEGRGKVATWGMVVIGVVRKLRNKVGVKLGLRNQTEEFGKSKLTVN